VHIDNNEAIEGVSLPDTPYIYVNGKVYSVVETNIASPLEAVKRFYESKVASHRRLYEGIAVQECASTTSAALERLDRYNDIQRAKNSANAITIPRELYDRLIITINGRLYHAHLFTHKYRYFKGVRSYIERYILLANYIDMSKYTNETQFIVEVKKPTLATVIYGYTKGSVICIFGRSLHTLSGRGVCTGDMSKDVFWSKLLANDPYVNIVNLDSLASQGISCVESNFEPISINTILKDSTVASVKYLSGPVVSTEGGADTAVENREGDVWRV